MAETSRKVSSMLYIEHIYIHPRQPNLVQFPLPLLFPSKTVIRPLQLIIFGYCNRNTATMTQETQQRVLQTMFKTASGLNPLSQPRMLEFVDEVSAPLATKMLRQIGLDRASQPPFKLLDNGAGLGVVAAQVQTMVDKDVLGKSSVISADFSEAYVEFVRERIESEGWRNTEARVVDAQVGGKLRRT